MQRRYHSRYTAPRRPLAPSRGGGARRYAASPQRATSRRTASSGWDFIPNDPVWGGWWYKQYSASPEVIARVKSDPRGGWMWWVEAYLGGAPYEHVSDGQFLTPEEAQRDADRFVSKNYRGVAPTAARRMASLPDWLFNERDWVETGGPTTELHYTYTMGNYEFEVVDEYPEWSWSVWNNGRLLAEGVERGAEDFLPAARRAYEAYQAYISSQPVKADQMALFARRWNKQEWRESRRATRRMANNPYSPEGNPYVEPPVTPGMPDDALDGPQNPHPTTFITDLPMDNDPEDGPVVPSGTVARRRRKYALMVNDIITDNPHLTTAQAQRLASRVMREYLSPRRG